MKEMKWEMVGWRKLLNTDDFFLIKYKYVLEYHSGSGTGTSVCFWTALSFSNPRLCSFCHLCHLKFLYLYTLTFVCVLFVLFTSYIAFVFLAFFICSLLVSFPSYLFSSDAPCWWFGATAGSQSECSQSGTGGQHPAGERCSEDKPSCSRTGNKRYTAWRELVAMKPGEPLISMTSSLSTNPATFNM